MILPIFKYKLIKELPITALNLKQFQTHKRLKVFYQKGTICPVCGREGTKLILGKNSSGSLHWDVYCDDYIPMNRDHIIPKSKGGSNHINNLQPMCSPCNTLKGNGSKNYSWGALCYWPRKQQMKQLLTIDSNILVWRKSGSKGFKKLGVVNRIIENSNVSNFIRFTVIGNDLSIYTFDKNIYIKK